MVARNPAPSGVSSGEAVPSRPGGSTSTDASSARVGVGDDEPPDVFGPDGVALALSGGGSRAIAFHLGCLRALRELELLEHVDTISTVSGGSVIGAMYALDGHDFDVFEANVRQLLARGLARSLVRRLFLSPHGWLVILNKLWQICIGTLIAMPRALVRGLEHIGIKAPSRTRHDPPFSQRVGLATLLAAELDGRRFDGVRLQEVPDRQGLLIVNACDLIESSAFYFSSSASGSHACGRLVDTDVTLADAVAASAAYPAFFAALDRTYAFEDRHGRRRPHRVSLTDGGVYDNTALSPLWPGRRADISLNVRKASTVIACRAGYGIQGNSLSHLWPRRMVQVLGVALNRAENASVQRLFEHREAGRYTNVVLAYLGQNDTKLSSQPADYVDRESVYDYPTNFSAMSPEPLERLVRRGEQQMHLVIEQHCPHLIRPGPRPVGTAAVR